MTVPIGRWTAWWEGVGSRPRGRAGRAGVGLALLALAAGVALAVLATFWWHVPGVAVALLVVSLVLAGGGLALAARRPEALNRRGSGGAARGAPRWRGPRGSRP